MLLHPTRLISILIFLVLGISASGAHQSEDGIPNLPETVQDSGLSTVESKIAEIASDTSLDDATRARLTDLYESALKQLKSAENYRAETDSYRESALQANKEIENINKQLGQTIEASKKDTSVDYTKTPPDRLDSLLFETRLRLESLKNNLEQLGRSLKQQQSRPEQIRIDQRSIQDKLHEIAERQRALSPSGDSLNKAQRIALNATEKALQANLNALQMELSSHPARLQLLRAQYDLAIGKVASESARLESLEKFIAENRESEAERYSKELAQALESAANKHPLIRELIQENFDLGKEFRRLSEDIGTANLRLDELKQDHKKIQSEAENSEKKISLAGLSPTLAAILREQRRLLPSESKIDRIAEKLVAKTGEVTLRQFEIEERLQNFLNRSHEIDDRLAMSREDAEISDSRLMRIRVELNLLLEEQKSLLLKLNEAYSKLLSILGEIDYSKEGLAEVARDYAAFLDENLLWVKSSPPVDREFLFSLGRAARWLLSPGQWWETGARLVTTFEARKFMTIPLFLVVFGLLVARRKIKARLKAISELVGVARNDRFRYTLDAIGLILLTVAPWFILVYWSGWLLDTTIGNPEFAKAAGRALLAASIPLVLLQTFYRIFAKGGIAELHLKWHRKTVSSLRAPTAWLRFIVVPCVFLITLTANQSVTEYSDSLGRFVLMVIMIAMSFSLGRVLHPSQGALKYFLADRPDSLISRTRYLWYSAILIVPLIIVGFAGAGYLASAIELEEKLVATIRIVFIAVFIHALVLRALRLYNRELAMKKLREKREIEKTAKSVGEAGEALPPVDQAEIKISTINSQTMRVVLTVVVFGALIALWLLWEDVLPALAILNEWVLWHKTVTVDGVETLKPVSISNLLIVIIYILVAISATRNLPGVMEVLIMNRFSIDSGSRHAINQLIGYGLIAATVILVAAELGGQWSELQWLVAALGVGLGFGLQEIFANFVSGIILLFERPIRIGDTVTVGEVSGTVSKIQIRATTITDWERKDLVVPNKTFITDQLINWTRTDNITRILIPIGIAYGSDTVLAHKIMIEIVRSHPRVLKEPEATVFFVGFGESSLDFEIRLFVKEISDRLPLTHDIHMQLNAELNKQGIEIPFPQRDIHVRSSVAIPRTGSVSSPQTPPIPD